MSPLSLRRYRAERLLRSEFDALRNTVLAAVRPRLRSAGLEMDDADLEACYSQAWQGLYAAVLSGEEIQNLTGWLVLVTHRRAIDEQRTRRLGVQLTDATAAADYDFAAEIDDRTRLIQLLQGIRASLNEREQQAAALCYLQGLSRTEAAQRMGIGARRMQRLMEGRGPGRPGVAAKVGALVEAITEGRFCEAQASLMRALAFGMLDPGGDRHQIALAHRQACPACRAYVLSLRGLSGALPPVCLPGLLQGLGLSEAAGAAGQAGAHGGAVAGAPTRAAASTRTGAAAGAGKSAQGAAGVSSAMPGAGGAGIGLGVLKIGIAGTLLLSLGIGAAVLMSTPRHAPARRLTRATTHELAPAVLLPLRSLRGREGRRGRLPAHTRRGSPHTGSRPSRSVASARAFREFGIERRTTGAASTAGEPVAAGTPATATRPAGSTATATPSATSGLSREFGIE